MIAVRSAYNGLILTDATDPDFPEREVLYVHKYDCPELTLVKMLREVAKILGEHMDLSKIIIDIRDPHHGTKEAQPSPGADELVEGVSCPTDGRHGTGGVPARSRRGRTRR